MGLLFQAIWSTPWNHVVSSWKRHLLLLARGQSNISSTWKAHVYLCFTCWAKLDNEPDRPRKPRIHWTEQSTDECLLPDLIVRYQFCT